MITIQSLSITFVYKQKRKFIELNIFWVGSTLYIVECTKKEAKYVAEIHTDKRIELGKSRLKHND